MAVNGQLDPRTLKVFPSDDTESALAYVVDDYEAMRLAAQTAGIFLKLTDSYRTRERQVELKAYWTAMGKPYNAADVGTSIHGLGYALDIFCTNGSFDSPEYRWLQANARRFGFTQPAFAQRYGAAPEPWHWVHLPTSRVASVAASPAPPRSNFMADLTPLEQQTVKAAADRTLGTVQDLWIAESPDRKGSLVYVPRGAPGARPARLVTEADTNYLALLTEDVAKAVAAQSAVIDALSKKVDALSKAATAKTTTAKASS